MAADPVRNILFLCTGNSARSIEILARVNLPKAGLDSKTWREFETETRAVFADVFGMMERRIKIICALPPASLSDLEIQREIRTLGTGMPQLA